MLSIKEYRGIYTVEYNTPSLGCILSVSWDKPQAEKEYDKYESMTDSELKDYLTDVY